MTRSVVLCTTKLKSHKMIKQSLEAVNFELTAFNFEHLIFQGFDLPGCAVSQGQRQSHDQGNKTSIPDNGQVRIRSPEILPIR
jgi:hypothetical protein